MLNIVLFQPEIPSNTGNIGRTCVITGARLHLVGPLGFSLDDRALRRAGLAYWGSLDEVTYASWEDFLARNPTARGDRVHLLTKRGARTYARSTYRDGDYLVFGRESSGLPLELLDAHPELCERIPMRSDDDALGETAAPWRAEYAGLHPEARRDIAGNYVDERVGRITSLNLSNAVAIVLYEALRQTGFPGMEA